MPLSHIVMHFALCSAAARLGPQAELPVRLVVTDRIHRDVIDKHATVERYEGNTSSLEFDVPWGIYRASATMRVGRATCSGVQYFTVPRNHNRTVTMPLQNGRVANAPVPTLISGTAPFAYSYADPTVLVFPGGTKCGEPVGTPINANIDEVTDSDGYYASVYPSAALFGSGAYVVAVRLTDSHGGYHYIRVPGDFLGYSRGWPSSGTFNVTSGVIDYVAEQPENTLLCPRMYKTEVH